MPARPTGRWLLGAAVSAGAAAAIATTALSQDAAPAPSPFGDADGVLRLPEAVAVAPDGTVLVGDHASGRIQRFRDGRPAGSFGMAGRPCGRLGAVGGLAVARDGRVFVLDTDHSRVAVFAADGRLQRCFGERGQGRGQLSTSSGSFAGSTASGGIAVSGRYVYVADTGNHRVQRFGLDGRGAKVLGKGRLNVPQGLAVAGRRLLVADDGSHRVVELTTSGRFVRATQRDRVRLRFPYDVALGRDGRAYVADNNAHRIVVLDRRLRQVGSFGRQGRGAGRFTFPRALAVARGGNVLVADAANGRVAETTASGRWVRALGRDGRDGGWTTTPADVAVNAFGEVAVADANARISWFLLDGRFRGAWAQGRSFRQSTASVTAPRAVTFAGDRELRVVDGGQLRALGAGVARDLLPADERGVARLQVSDVVVEGDGTTWVLTGRGQVARIGRDGQPGPLLGTALPSGRSAGALALLRDGTIAFGESPAERLGARAVGSVRRMTRDGRALPAWTLRIPAGGDATRATGLLADDTGGAWVSDAGNDRVLHLDRTGAVVQTLGGAGRDAGQLIGPAGLAFDCDGGLVVAEAGGSRVQRFPGLGPRTGCRDAGRATVSTPPPRPVGLRLKVTERGTGRAARLASVRMTCARDCTRVVTASASVLAGGRMPQTLALRVAVRGSVARVSAGPASLRALRRALRVQGAYVAVGIEVAATSRDGVTDRDGVAVRLRR
ncbi:NHL repeat-containing protein [Conexibacter sp. SYSU D00693]|uniref:NHL repeat-containing protein n=1 Tax=Conexibacter sp. SYSU D00693 TaxID=2812560 RepID=UPI00196B4909|nr:NHL repeat-containing protein [Conexibacter sp. SYSU D00693]